MLTLHFQALYKGQKVGMHLLLENTVYLLDLPLLFILMYVYRKPLHAGVGKCLLKSRNVDS